MVQPYFVGPVFLVAPSDVTANVLATLPPPQAALHRLTMQMVDAVTELRGLLAEVDEVSSRIKGASLAAAQISGLADAMKETVVRSAGTNGRDARSGARAELLCASARSLLDALVAKTRNDVDARRVFPALKDRVDRSASTLAAFLTAADPRKIVATFAIDGAIPRATRCACLCDFAELVAYVMEVLSKTQQLDVCHDISRAVFDMGDLTGSLPAAVRGLVDTLLEPSDGVTEAAVIATGFVGNLPAPDSLSITLVKILVTRSIPEAALNAASAEELEGSIQGYLGTALKLDAPQRKSLQRLMKTLKAANSRAIARAAKRDRVLKSVTSTHHEFYTQSAATAENELEEARTAIADFAENNKLFAALQRGVLMDCFVVIANVELLLAGIKDLKNADVPRAKAWGELVSGVSLTVPAMLSLAGKHLLTKPIDIIVAQFKLSSIDSLAAPIAGFVGVIQIFSGVAEFAEGYATERADFEIEGGFVAAGGAFLVVGAICTSAVSMGLGIAIPIAYVVLKKQLTCPTKLAIETCLELLDSPVYQGISLVDFFELQTQIRGVKHAKDQWDCVLLAPNPSGKPSRESLIAGLRRLQFPDEDARKLLEQEPTAFSQAYFEHPMSDD